MKLNIVVTLDSGGTVTVRGDKLTAEAVQEVFAILARHRIASAEPEHAEPRP